MEIAYGFERVIVDTQVAETPLARRILDRWQGPTREIVADTTAIVEHARHEPNPLRCGKRTLLVTRRKGRFLSFCQGMTERHRACCGYRILNVVSNCPIDCSYCILQSYLDIPLVVLYANIEDLADEIEQVSRSRSDPVQDDSRAAGRGLLRIGTGELGDSLAFDRLTDLSLDLMRVVAPRRDVVLELKTKTVEIENLLSVPAPANVIASWSLNSDRLIESEEIGAASLAARLDAARRCQNHGYRLGFHFDPLVHGETWERDYHAVVEALFDCIAPSSIVWISLGGLRFPPEMKLTVEERFPQSTITAGEMIRSWDGKLRYFRPIRAAMYRKMVEWIRCRAPDVTVYLCMESQQIWQDVFGWSPRGVNDVAELLDAAYRKTKLTGSAMCAAN